MDRTGLGHLAQRLGAGKSVVSNLSDIGTVASDDSVGLMIDAERLAVGAGSVSTSPNAVIGTITSATQSEAGVMSASDKKKLDEDVALKDDVEAADFVATGIEVTNELVSVTEDDDDLRSRLKVRLAYEKGGVEESVEGSCYLDFPLAQPYQNSVYTGCAGLMSASDKAKLNGLPSAEYVKSISSGETIYSTKSAVLRFYVEKYSSSAIQQNEHRLTLAVATQSAAGVMSAADKAKLDGLDAVATQSKDGLMSAADKKKLDKIDPVELALLDDVDSVDFVPLGIEAETVAQAVVNNNSSPMVEMTLRYDKGGAEKSVKGTFTVELNTATASMGAIKGVGGLMSGDDKAKLDKMEPDELVRKGEVWQKDVSGDFDFNGATEAGCYFHDGTGSISNGPGESVALGGGFALWVVRTSSLCTMQLVRPGNMFMAGFVCFREFMHSLSSFGKWYIVNLNTLCGSTA